MHNSVTCVVQLTSVKSLRRLKYFDRILASHAHNMRLPKLNSHQREMTKTENEQHHACIQENLKAKSQIPLR